MNWLSMLQKLPAIADAIAQLQVKGWYLSKTIWSNLFVLVGSVVYALTGNDVFTISPDEAGALSLAAVAVANIILRILTRKPIGLRSVPGPAGTRSDQVEPYGDDLGI